MYGDDHSVCVCMCVSMCSYILGVTRFSQWNERITTKQLSAQFGMIADCLLERRLRWLGHLSRMDESRTPKQLLFGELLRRQPFRGTKKRWRDEIVGDLRAVGVGDGWYQLCQNRRQWSETCSSAVDILAQHRGTITCAANIFSNLGTFQCVCGRSFRRKGDLTRHRNFCRASN